MRQNFALSIAAACLLTVTPEVHAGVLNDYNPWNVDIPDAGSHVCSDLNLSGAPADAIITSVTVYYEIRHTYPGQLDVWITFYDGGWRDYPLYDQGDLGGDDDIVETRSGINHWDGFSPNQTWYLCVRDNVSGHIGYIDFFELWVTYESNECPVQPYNEDPDDGEDDVSITTNLDWSCSDPDGDTLYYTVYFEKNDSTPNDIIKDDATGSYADPGTLDYDSDYYWRVKADDHNGCVTWGPSSSGSWHFRTEPAPVIDAAVTVSSVTPNPVVPGNTITINYTVDNTGNVSHSFGVGCEIWQGGTLKASVGAEMTATISPTQAPYSGSFSHTIPGGWSAGTYTARCAVWSEWPGDPGSEHLDYDDRNFSVQAVEISADVEIPSVTPNPVVAGNTITINYTVDNTGNVSHSFGVGCEIWQGGTLKASVGAEMTATISPTQAPYSGSFSHTIPGGWSAGTYTARCAVWSEWPGDPGSEHLDYDDRNFDVDAAPISAAILSIAFDLTQVVRGLETITAYIAIRNTSPVPFTFYVGASSVKTGGQDWHDWSPFRSSLTLDVNETRTVARSWAPDQSIAPGTYGFYVKVFQAPSGSDFVAEDFIDSAFPVVDNPSPVLVQPAEIIVHTYDNFLTQDPQVLIDHCLATGIPAMSVAIKDEDPHSYPGDPEGYVGHLFFDATDEYGSPLEYTRRFNDDRFVDSFFEDLTRKAHDSGLRVYAWMSMFNDELLGHLAEGDSQDYFMYERDSASPGSEPYKVMGDNGYWVSPIAQGVRQHHVDVLDAALAKFGFDGVRIDHSRYLSDWTDMSATARQTFAAHTAGFDPVDLTGPGGDHWLDWVNWRADAISSFNESIRDATLARTPTAAVGAYLFPGPAQLLGYENRTWAGQRYEDYGVTGINLQINPMPMLYWQTGWAGDPYDSAAVFQWISDRLHYGRQLAAPTELIPVLSVTSYVDPYGPHPGSWWPEEDIRVYLSGCLEKCRENGVSQVSYYFHGYWNPAWFERIRATYVSPVLAVTPGFIDFGQIPAGTSEIRQFTVANVGQGVLAVSVAKGADACGAFSLVGPTNLSLLQGESATVAVRFSPSGEGACEGTIVFSGPGSSTTSRMLIGQGGDCATDGDCDDGLFCNGIETCEAGVCVDGSDPCADLAHCDEVSDVCICVYDSECDDGVFCNGVETCDVTGYCQAGTAIDCNDGVSCTADSCNEGTDSCDNIPDDALCDNGLWCDGTETCDPLADCQPGTDVDCSDGVDCTVNSCNEGTDSCDNIPDDALCDNGLWCDGTETCDPVADCQPGSEPCIDLAHCDEVIDVCICADDNDCDDGLTCTTDSCNQQNHCEYALDAGYCLIAATCYSAGDANPANDCQECDPPTDANGWSPSSEGTACGDSADTECDHANTCDGAGTCLDNQEPDGTSCTDGSFCNGEETCQAGACTLGTEPCDTNEECDEILDVCYVPCNTAGDCEDPPLFCNGEETCVAGRCVDGTPPCTAGQTCNEDTDTCETPPPPPPPPPPPSPHPADHAQSWGGDCTCATCEDDRIEMCEAIGYAAAFFRGNHDDEAGTMQGLALWMSGELYHWDDSEDDWVPGPEE